MLRTNSRVWSCATASSSPTSSAKMSSKNKESILTGSLSVSRKSMNLLFALQLTWGKFCTKTLNCYWFSEILVCKPRNTRWYRYHMQISSQISGTEEHSCGLKLQVKHSVIRMNKTRKSRLATSTSIRTSFPWTNLYSNWYPSLVLPWK